jgi:subtilisin family serine protease
VYVKQISSILKKYSTILIIFLCLFSYNSYGYVIDFSSLEQNSNPTELASIFQEEVFLNKILQSNDNDNFRVIVKVRNEDAVRSLNIVGKSMKKFNSFNGLAVTLSRSDLLSQINTGNILALWENSVIKATGSDYQLTSLGLVREIDDYNSKVNSQFLWDLGYFGNDSIVAILDTGIKTDHLALETNMDGENRIVDGWNFIDNNANIEDDNGHGTEVAGIIGGNGLFGYDRGVAPNCKFLIGKILTYDATGSIEDLIEGIDWALANGADVINLSLGKVVTDKESPEIQAVNNAIESGVIVCVSSGNSRGIAEFGYNDKYTILSPGIAMKAITVGAIDNNKILYEESSAGPVAVNYDANTDNFLFDSIDKDDTWLKPDVVAPGVLLNTTSTEIQGTEIVSGTSYSTAVVSGVCALLNQKYPNSKPSVIKASLLETSESLVIDYISPFVEYINFYVPEVYQGAGLVDANASSIYLQNPEKITIWPSIMPYAQEVFFRNERHSFYIHLFINEEIDSLIVSLPGPLREFIDLSIPSNYDIGQYDILVELKTENQFSGYIGSYINFNASSEIFSLDVYFYVKAARGRILLDTNEVGDQQFYSIFGNLNNFIDIAKFYGLIPEILKRDLYSPSFAEMNLNDYEVIALINHNSSLLHSFSVLDSSSISDYILPNGDYEGGSVIFLPSQESDIDNLNSILGTINTSYAITGIINETLDLSSNDHKLTSDPNYIVDIFQPSVFDVIKANDTINTISDRFVSFDDRNNNGSLVLALNDVSAFLDSPYLYNALKMDYDISNLVLNFGDNLELLHNVLENSVVTSVNFDYSISNLEVIQGKEILEIRVNATNIYKPLTDWDFFLTVEKEDTILAREFNIIDCKNGTHLILFNPANYSISPGKYTISVRSSTGSYSWEIQVLAKVSWGPIVVEISLALCIVYLLITRRRKTK